MWNKDNYCGIGYVLSEHDPYTAIDLDNYTIDGKMTNEAMEIVNKVNRFTEVT